MWKLLVLSLVAVGMTQLIFPGGLVIDTAGGLRVEYDDQHNIILLVNQTACYIVEAPDATWDPLVRDREHLHASALAITKQIEEKTGLTEITHRNATRTYESRLEEFQCFRKHVYIVDYKPTSA